MMICAYLSLFLYRVILSMGVCHPPRDAVGPLAAAPLASAISVPSSVHLSCVLLFSRGLCCGVRACCLLIFLARCVVCMCMYWCSSFYSREV